MKVADQAECNERNGRAMGYHGRYLRVDLAEACGRFVPLRPEVLRRFLGGSGLGAYLMLAEQAAYPDALSPGAPIALVFSPLVGTTLTTSAKFAVVSKSPLTDRFNDSMASSGFAMAGKKCGCDAIVIVGRCAAPSVLVIEDGAVRLEAAGDLWGLAGDRAEQLVRQRLGADYRVAAIGPAGERLVRYATISHDGRHAARGGAGAVLGSKNLKAVAVRGTRECPVAHPHQLSVLAKELSRKSFGPATAKYRELGTASNLLLFNRLAALPTRNFQQGRFAGVEQLAPEALGTSHQRVRAHCAACTIGCAHIYSLHEPGQHGQPSAGVRVEYENLFALGPLCGIHDADVVLRASRRCDQLGLDAISTGGTIAFAMECVERGLLGEAWLRFGDGPALLEAIERIGRPPGNRRLAGRGQPPTGSAHRWRVDLLCPPDQRTGTARL